MLVYRRVTFNFSKLFSNISTNLLNKNRFAWILGTLKSRMPNETWFSNLGGGWRILPESSEISLGEAHMTHWNSVPPSRVKNMRLSPRFDLKYPLESSWPACKPSNSHDGTQVGLNQVVYKTVKGPEIEMWKRFEFGSCGLWWGSGTWRCVIPVHCGFGAIDILNPCLCEEIWRNINSSPTNNRKAAKDEGMTYS